MVITHIAFDAPKARKWHSGKWKTEVIGLCYLDQGGTSSSGLWSHRCQSEAQPHQRCLLKTAPRGPSKHSERQRTQRQEQKILLDCCGTERICTEGKRNILLIVYTRRGDRSIMTLVPSAAQGGWGLSPAGSRPATGSPVETPWEQQNHGVQGGCGTSPHWGISVRQVRGENGGVAPLTDWDWRVL